jgi:hypothetical protein
MTATKTLTASLFRPTSSLTGGEAPSIFRGENLVLRGASGGIPYFEVFGGNKDLAENYNLNAAAFKLTGTIDYTAGNQVVTGTGTAFISELHIGQMILSGTEVFVVQEITDNTHFVSFRAPSGSAAAQVGRRLPQLFQINGKRGVMLTGNAIQFEKGHIIAVGSGELHINGATLPGSSLTATNKPKIALYRATTADYEIRALGFANTPPKPVVNAVAGGTKKMADGKNSFMIAYWSALPDGTDGYSNPCEVVKLDGAAAPLAISTADGKTRYEFDFTTSLVGMPSNATGFVVFGSLSGKKSVSTSGGTATTTSPNETNYENGSWFRTHKIKVSDLVANKAFIEYLDSDVFEEVTGNNDAPPACEFVAKIEGKPMYISCYGRSRVGGDAEGSNPGQACVVSKYGNPDGAPTEWAASISHDIIGWFEGVGRWFLMTASTLDFIVSTGLLGQSFSGTQQLELPIISRPYWKTGASNRYSVILVDDTLYGFSGNKLFKSVGNGDENVQKYEFGSPVEDITRLWNGGFVLTAHDAKNNNVCFIYSAAYKNAQGYWVSLILPYSLFRDAWLPLIVLSSPTRDMIVSGAANINERMEFLAGGRVSGGTFQTSTFRFDETDTVNPLTSMPYYLLWQPSDDGEESKSKQIHSIRPVGKFTSMKIQIHGARPGEPLIVANMEAGANSISGDIAFPDTDEITRGLVGKMAYKNLAMYAIRLSGNWDGAGMKDRIDEIAVEVSTHGRAR